MKQIIAQQNTAKRLPEFAEFIQFPTLRKGQKVNFISPQIVSIGDIIGHTENKDPNSNFIPEYKVLESELVNYLPNYDIEDSGTQWGCYSILVTPFVDQKK